MPPFVDEREGETDKITDLDVDEDKVARLLDAEAARRPRFMAEDRKADGTVVRP